MTGIHRWIEFCDFMSIPEERQLDIEPHWAAMWLALFRNSQTAASYRSHLKFASQPLEQLEARLGGSWGVWDGSLRHDKQRARAAASRGMASLGTHFFMRVERERCTSTLRGLANLPVHESFSLWGKPTIGSAQAELDARSAAGGSTDLVTGHCYFGTSADREWYTCGRFSLLRDTDRPAGDEADE